MSLFDIFKKKKKQDEIPPSTWLPTPPPITDYDRNGRAEKIIEKINNSNNLTEIAQVLAENGLISAPKDNKHNTFGQSIEHLDEDGELPFGWIAHNKKFIDKIQGDFNYFLNRWLSSKKANDPLQEFSGLKSLILYIQDCQELCYEKGECFYKWFSDCVADEEYFGKRIEDLKYLEDHMDELLQKAEIEKNIERNLLPHLRADLLKIIKESPEILQTDVYKRFVPAAKEHVSSELYSLSKDGLIVREKSGRTYKLHIKN